MRMLLGVVMVSVSLTSSSIQRPSFVKPGLRCATVVVDAGGYSPVPWPSCGSVLDGRARPQVDVKLGPDEAGKWSIQGTIRHTSARIDVARCSEFFVPQHECGVEVYNKNTRGEWGGVSEHGEKGSQPEYSGFIRRKASNPDGKGLPGCYIQVRNWRQAPTEYVFAWSDQNHGLLKDNPPCETIQSK